MKIISGALLLCLGGVFAYYLKAERVPPRRSISALAAACNSAAAACAASVGLIRASGVAETLRQTVAYTYETGWLWKRSVLRKLPVEHILRRPAVSGFS
jgi:hypothetical protein